MRAAREFNLHDHQLLDVQHRCGNYGHCRSGAGLTGGYRRSRTDHHAATIDHIREYGTLKAIGGTNGYIYRIILQQAAVSGMIGYAVGIAIAVLVAGSATRSGGADIVLPGGVQAGLFALTLLMCASAAIVSIRSNPRIDPAMVFRG